MVEGGRGREAEKRVDRWRQEAWLVKERAENGGGDSECMYLKRPTGIRRWCVWVCVSVCVARVGVGAGVWYGRVCLPRNEP